VSGLLLCVVLWVVPAKLAHLCRGAVAGAASRTGTAPLSLVVARNQVASCGSGGIVSVMKELYLKVTSAQQNPSRHI
jgi:hypothetical protein